MLKKSFSSLLIIIICSTAPCAALSIRILQETDMSTFSVIDANMVHTGSQACVSKVTDGKQVYILKQIDSNAAEEQCALVNDCIASQIGCAAGIPVNEVAFIPHYVAKHLKQYPDCAATLHTYMPGKDIESELPDCVNEEFTIHQRVRNIHSLWQQHHGLLAEDKQGLTRRVIESMTIHDTLPSFAALDTFVGNSDRSWPNIFYDKDQHAFYGIDLAAAFKRGLPLYAHTRLNELKHDGYFSTCSPVVLKSLRTYRDVLLNIAQTITPDEMITATQQLVIYLGVTEQEELSVVMDTHCRIVTNNYQNTLKLLDLLSTILGK